MKKKNDISLFPACSAVQIWSVGTGRAIEKSTD